MSAAFALTDPVAKAANLAVAAGLPVTVTVDLQGETNWLAVLGEPGNFPLGPDSLVSPELVADGRSFALGRPEFAGDLVAADTVSDEHWFDELLSFVIETVTDLLARACPNGRIQLDASDPAYLTWSLTAEPLDDLDERRAERRISRQD
ncbi:hypothetical protein [Cryobacterium sp. PH31-O1]|uniref:hypothetical protein n=1 Tax=Cryobacterium sp. PH31-O1 TaxID=3046306 RepID=UPI0024BA5FC5|nr:hypothetical protein [Cryobacterium sp. PH31-O1]MDJ0338246.1 hypothetical protein [Cryobacterium sp. PH31-O1]